MSENRTVLFDRNKMIRLMLPILGEQFLAISLGLFDSVMVASCGEAAVSGISLVDSISVLFIQILSALATGGAVIISRYIGQDHKGHAKLASGQLMLVLVTSSLGLMLIILFSYRFLIVIIFGKIEADVMESAVTYFFISALSYPALGAYNAGAAVFRSQGNSRISLLASLVMNIFNLGGNALLIYGFNMGVAGAAIATTASRFIAAFAVIWFLQKKNPVLALTPKTFFIPDPKMIKRILSIGIPSGIENGMFQIGKLMLASMISGFGTVAITANAIGGNVSAFFNVPGSAVCQTMHVVIGQAVGYGDRKETLRYGRLLHRIGLISEFAAQSLHLILLRPILLLYQLSDATYFETARLLTTCAICSMFFWAESFCTPNILRAAGKVKYSMVVSTFSMWVFRIGSAIILAKVFSLGVLGVWIGMYIDWVFRAAAFYGSYRRGRWAGVTVE